MKEIIIQIDIDPVPKGRPRFSSFGRFPKVYTPSATKRYEDTLKTKFRSAYKGAPIDHEIFVSVTFYLKKPKTSKNIHPKTKPDLDNYLKAVLDAGNGILWKDDALITEIHCKKAYSDTVFSESGAIILSVSELQPE